MLTASLAVRHTHRAFTRPDAQPAQQRFRAFPEPGTVGRCGGGIPARDADAGQRDELSRDYGDKRSELKHAEIALPGAAAWAVEAFGEAAFYRALEEVRDEAKGRVLTDGQAERAAWARVSEQLWTSVEDGEDRLNRRRKDARLARTVTIALPAMLSRSSQIALMRGYVEETFTAQGMIADWVLHDTGDGNPHVHVMLTLREIGEEYWGLKNRGWNHVSMLQEQRALWASHANAMLEREGFAERIDHRTLEAQQLELDAEAGLEPESWNPHVADHMWPITRTGWGMLRGRGFGVRRCGKRTGRISGPTRNISLWLCSRSGRCFRSGMSGRRSRSGWGSMPNVTGRRLAGWLGWRWRPPICCRWRVWISGRKAGRTQARPAIRFTSPPGRRVRSSRWRGMRNVWRGSGWRETGRLSERGLCGPRWRARRRQAVSGRARPSAPRTQGLDRIWALARRLSGSRRMHWRPAPVPY